MKPHDRLCPCFGGIGPEDWPDTRVCRCDLIAKVRVDQDRIHREEMQSLVLAARKVKP